MTITGIISRIMEINNNFKVPRSCQLKFLAVTRHFLIPYSKILGDSDQGFQHPCLRAAPAQRVCFPNQTLPPRFGERPPLFCQRILNLRRHLSVHLALNDFVSLKFTELFRQNPLRDIGDCPTKLTGPHRTATKMAQNDRLPFAANYTECCFYGHMIDLFRAALVNPQS